MDKDNLVLFSRDKDQELADEFKAIIHYTDGEVQEIIATFFGNAPETNNVLVFFNENISENPIALINMALIKKISMVDIPKIQNTTSH